MNNEYEAIDGKSRVQAERIWVVLTDTEDNLSFVSSIAADKWIRRRCLISTEGSAIGHEI